MTKPVLYEVGTYEQYEEGFHAFYRTFDKERAEFVKQTCSDFLSRHIELTDQYSKDVITIKQLTEKEEELHFELNVLISSNISIRSWSALYTIKINETHIDF